jgi:ABC-type bacteriocin/lantibiotic exporter with double-glycine peptidase domain
MQALARVVYARCQIVLLDDSLSALNGRTENRIAENLLGPAGHFKKMGTTVFLVSNASKSHKLLPEGGKISYCIQHNIFT